MLYPESASRNARLKQSDVTNLVMVFVLGIFLVMPYVIASVAGNATDIWVTIASLVMVASLAFRNREPFVCLGLALLGGAIQLLISPWPTLSFAVVPIVAYSVAREVPGHEARIVLLLGGVGSIVVPIRWVFGTATTQDTFTVLFSIFLFSSVCLATILTSYLFGRRALEAEQMEMRRQASIQQAYEQELRASEQRARMAEIRIRNDIARELHDIVAHSLSVIIVQAEGGRAMAEKKPETASQVLDTIAENGREALTEMRRIVGVLRSESTEEPNYSPTPGLKDIQGLVERCGDRVELLVEGQEPVVPQTLGLTAYRVAQEALTNFLKHAGPEAVATVTLRYSPTMMMVEVLDDGIGNLAVNDGEGNGLRGMHERVSAMNGRLVYGPLPEGGFAVKAFLPITDTPNKPNSVDNPYIVHRTQELARTPGTEHANE